MRRNPAVGLAGVLAVAASLPMLAGAAETMVAPRVPVEADLDALLFGGRLPSEDFLRGYVLQEFGWSELNLLGRDPGKVERRRQVEDRIRDLETRLVAHARRRGLVKDAPARAAREPQGGGSLDRAEVPRETGPGEDRLYLVETAPTRSGDPRVPSGGRILGPGTIDDRVSDSGTEGIFGGAAGPAYLPRGRRRALGTPPPSDAPTGDRSATSSAIFRAEAGTDELTRWERAKYWIRRLFEAYVRGDLPGVMQCLSRDFAQDASIFRNAVLEDFQNDGNINVDVELLEYRMSFDSLIARVGWNRAAVRLANGTALAAQSGECEIVFDRHHRMRLKMLRGQMPVGLRDPEWVRQAEAGQHQSGFPGGGGGGGGAVVVNGPTVVLNEGTGQDHLRMNLETGSVQVYDPSSCAPNCTAFPIDLTLGLNTCSAFLDFLVLQGGHPLNANPPYGPPPALGQCVPGSVVTDFGDVIAGSLGISDNFSTGNPVAGETVVYALQTAEGNFALVEFVLTTLVGGCGSAQIQVQTRWFLGGASPGGVGTGTSSCP